VKDWNPRARDIIAPGALHSNAPLLSDQEIADRLGVSRAAVFYQRLRALRKLRAGILADPVLRELASEVCGYTIVEVKSDA